MESPKMSPATVDRLKRAHDARTTEGPEALYALVRALRTAGWTLAAIAEPLGVTREAVRLWEQKYEELVLPSVTVEVPAYGVPKAVVEAEEAAARKSARERREAEVLRQNLPRLLALQDDAQNLRGPTARNPGRADASREYTALIDETVRAGVRARVLADALGVKMITVNARLRRSGLRQTAPSEKVPNWAKTPEWQQHAAEVRGRGA